MRLLPWLVAACLLAALPAAGRADDANAPVLRGGLPTDEEPAAAPDTTGQPAPSLDPVVTGATPRANTRVTPKAPVAAVAPTRRPPPEADPFAPLGIRAGSFILYPSVTTGIGYTNNATTAAHGKPSAFLEVAPEFLVKSDWSRNEATLALRGSFQKFLDGSTESNPTGQIEATGRIDLPDQWTLSLSATDDYSHEAFSDPNFPAGADKAPLVNDLSGAAKLSGAFGRNDLTFETDVERTTYADAHSGSTVIDQSDRDNVLYGGRIRYGYEWTPLLTPFIEGQATRRVFDQTFDHNSIARASTGFALRAGVAYNSDPVLSGELALGVRKETFDDSALSDISAFTVDGSVVWSPTPLVTVTGNLGTFVKPSTDPASSGSVVYDGSIDVAYAYRPNLGFDLKAGVEDEHFQGIGLTDRTYVASLAATWKLNRQLALIGSYTHQWLASDTPPNDYAADTVRVDLRYQH